MQLRVDRIFEEDFKDDTSFLKEGGGMLTSLFRKPYNNMDMREAFHTGIKLGIETGLRHSSVEGQKLELSNNIKNEKHREFLDKFYNLCNEYNICISYHPEKGMTLRTYKVINS